MYKCVNLKKKKKENKQETKGGNGGTYTYLQYRQSSRGQTFNIQTNTYHLNKHITCEQKKKHATEIHNMQTKKNMQH